MLFKLSAIAVFSLGFLFALNNEAIPENNQTDEAIDTLRLYDFPEFQIIEHPSRLFSNVSGSVEEIDRKTLDEINAVDNNEVLRQISGINVNDEEGMGLRANIGVRGLDPARSRNVLVMEDGIPVALAPYGEPEMYYSPSMDRMRGVEVIKGSGNILYGPQTVGGVINYLTPEPPSETTGRIGLSGGEGGYFRARGEVGTNFGESGAGNINFLHKRATDIGILSFETYDVSSRFRFDLNESNRLSIKLGFFDEISNSTYIGLTQPMYDNGEYFTEMAPDDRLNMRRYSFSANHSFFWTDDTRLNTNVYAYTTSRYWQRQDFTLNEFDEDGSSMPEPENHTGTTWGDESVENGAVFMQNSTGNRNRDFDVAGIEPRLSHTYELAGMTNDLDAGTRFHFEQAFEQRINGNKKNSPSGTIRDDEVRTGKAVSGFLQNRFHFTEKLSLTAGARAEWFDYTRDIRRGRFDIEGITQIRDTSVVSNDQVFEVIPGGGVNFEAMDNLNLYAGVHRGFSPPRIKDAISPEGEARQLDAELSWNYEAGFRAEPFNFLYVEATGFLMDFENQIIPVAEYVGETGAGLINAGATRHQGVELSARLNFDGLFDDRVGLIWRNNMTYTDARYKDDQREIDQTSIKDNKTPYSPGLTGTSHLSLTFHDKLATGISFNYTGEQYTDELNREEPTNDGRQGVIPAYSLIDLNAAYEVTGWNTRFTISAKNLLDERYIASRRPRGIKVGSPRMLTAGAEYRF